jgi:hypothetical protein
MSNSGIVDFSGVTAPCERLLGAKATLIARLTLLSSVVGLVLCLAPLAVRLLGISDGGFAITAAGFGCVLAFAGVAVGAGVFFWSLARRAPSPAAVAAVALGVLALVAAFAQVAHFLLTVVPTSS